MKRTQEEMEQEWQKVMNAIWKELKEVGARNDGQNQIELHYSGGNWRIGAYMINNEYIEVKLTLHHVEQATLRYNKTVRIMSESAALQRLVQIITKIIL